MMAQSLFLAQLPLAQHEHSIQTQQGQLRPVAHRTDFLVNEEGILVPFAPKESNYKVEFTRVPVSWRLGGRTCGANEPGLLTGAQM
jgi:hypothetical protein